MNLPRGILKDGWNSTIQHRFICLQGTKFQITKSGLRAEIGFLQLENRREPVGHTSFGQMRCTRKMQVSDTDHYLKTVIEVQ